MIDIYPNIRVIPTTVSTIEPSLSTNTPSFVTLGIAAHVRSESYTTEYPNNYSVVITKNIFGVPQSNQCELHDVNNHFVATTEPTGTYRQRYAHLYTGNRVILRIM
ncbi:unnamed protein product [Rotaria sp. Silwood2]|nr:unnamed protein product [Rotaria sp. Silwood2]CAF3325311.1 unnamed protein product [Rotaria sp. Silwood2]CAF4148941.1 unnamed protein product [Rotaria sp. Silwood2]CAF4203209.1 unnamed protein product [Rotaria sp. Silwood2]